MHTLHTRHHTPHTMHTLHTLHTRPLPRSVSSSLWRPSHSVTYRYLPLQERLELKSEALRSFAHAMDIATRHVGEAHAITAELRSAYAAASDEMLKSNAAASARARRAAPPAAQPYERRGPPPAGSPRGGLTPRKMAYDRVRQQQLESVRKHVQNLSSVRTGEYVRPPAVPHVARDPDAFVPRDAALTNAEGNVTEILKQWMAQHSTRVMTLFRKWDTDQNGLVDRTEFHHALKTLGLQAPSEEVDALFSSYDKDRSGSLDFRELNRSLRTTSADEKLKKLANARPPINPRPASARPACEPSPPPDQRTTRAFNGRSAAPCRSFEAASARPQSARPQSAMPQSSGARGAVAPKPPPVSAAAPKPVATPKAAPKAAAATPKAAPKAASADAVAVACVDGAIAAATLTPQQLKVELASAQEALQKGKMLTPEQLAALKVAQDEQQAADAAAATATGAAGATATGAAGVEMSADEILAQVDKLLDEAKAGGK